VRRKKIEKSKSGTGARCAHHAHAIIGDISYARVASRHGVSCGRISAHQSGIKQRRAAATYHGRRKNRIAWQRACVTRASRSNSVARHGQ